MITPRVAFLWLTHICTSYVFAVTPVFVEPPSMYPHSGYFTMTVDGHDVPVIAFDGYAYTHFAFENSPATIKITSSTQTSITSFFTSPHDYGYDDSGVVSGNTLTFTMNGPQYLIIKLDGVEELVIVADPLETDIPPASGTGIFNVATQYGADASGQTVTTDSFTNAIQSAGARGQGSIIYVPPGTYMTIGLTGINHHNLNGTEWIRTNFDSRDIKIYGRGIIDVKGDRGQKQDKFIAHAVVPMNTTRFTFDGPIIRDSGSWTVMPTRSSYVVIDHVKVLNRMDLSENDAFDVQESQHVVVQNSIGIALDDSFSTKTWPKAEGISINYPGDPQPLYNVTFSNNLAWTNCYGFKVGQGVWEDQQMVRFEKGTVYDAAVGLGIHHKWGSAAVNGVQFTEMSIEHLHGANDGHQTWLAIFVQAGTPGIIGPIGNVSLWTIAVRARGTTPALTQGVEGAFVSDVGLRQIWFKDTGTYATTLGEMSITETDFSVNVAVKG